MSRYRKVAALSLIVVIIVVAGFATGLLETNTTAIDTTGTVYADTDTDTTNWSGRNCISYEISVFSTGSGNGTTPSCLRSRNVPEGGLICDQKGLSLIGPIGSFNK
jgi:hypothetical protein